MRESHVCPKCHHNRVLFVAEVPNSHGKFGFQPAAAALTIKSGAGFFGGDVVDAVGRMSSCICRRCGYTELYTIGFEQIPVDGTRVQELVGPVPETPYR